MTDKTLQKEMNENLDRSRITDVKSVGVDSAFLSHSGIV